LELYFNPNKSSNGQWDELEDKNFVNLNIRKARNYQRFNKYKHMEAVELNNVLIKNGEINDPADYDFEKHWNSQIQKFEKIDKIKEPKIPGGDSKAAQFIKRRPIKNQIYPLEARFKPEEIYKDVSATE
jgi:hypothetical protein